MTLLVGLTGHRLQVHWETWSLQLKSLGDKGCFFQNLQDWDSSKLHRWHLILPGQLRVEDMPSRPDGIVVGGRVSGFKSCLHHL